MAHSINSQKKLSKRKRGLLPLLVRCYRIWHGRMKLRGLGLTIRILAPHFKSLQSYPLQLPEGQTLHLDFRDVSAWYWMNYTLGDRLEEEGLLQALRRVSKPGDTIWDVGANCGLFSYILARNLPDCRIVFFEPNPFVYGIARSALRPFANVQGMNIGLSSSTRENTPLTLPRGGSTVGTLEPKQLGRVGPVISVSVDTGDQIIDKHGLPAPDTIKIDAEGHESEILKGLSRTIEQRTPKIFFEHIGLTNHTIQNIVPRGYNLHSVADDTGEIQRSFERRTGHNALLMPSEDTI